MNIEQLCDEVNRVLQARHITVADARTSSVVSPRNVRYYRTIGLLTPPSRSEGRAEYEQDHVDQIVAIKQAQQDGISLEQLIEQQETKSPLDTTRFTLNANFMTTYAREIPNSDFALRSESRDVGIIEASAKQDEFIGWSVHFESVVLSGYGTAPTREQIDAIRRILEL